ncbi:hypothetical protein NEIRO03_1462 [Nematocida sp. AWRm78]|nr:hypothetical protein NEIRO02_1664 [Nematocida sp. AWRm79]KAI5183995.1 hypothetical protein NEIRO03_1462 [Nematocida sp. AWRm78]
MNIKPRGIFDYKGNRSIIIVVKGKHKGSRAYIQMIIDSDYIPYIGIFGILHPLQSTLYDSFGERIETELIEIYKTQITTISLDRERLELTLPSITCQFASPVDFTMWVSHLHWLIHALKKLSYNNAHIWLNCSNTSIDDEFFVFGKYFTPRDWKVSLQINNRMSSTSDMDHYDIYSRTVPQPSIKQHCMGREELNKQYYLQNNWNNPDIMKYVEEISPADENMPFHVHIFGKYYKLLCGTTNSSRICTDWANNPYCCCQYKYYDGNQVLCEMPLSTTVNSYKSHKKEILSEIYMKNSDVLHRYCMAYLRTFHSVEERMKFYFGFIIKNENIINNVIPNKTERSRFSEQCRFEEILKYSVDTFGIKISEIHSKDYLNIPAVKSVLDSESDLFLEFNGLFKYSQEDIDKRWIPTDIPNVYIMITNGVYLVECMCSIANDPSLLSYTYTSQLLKSSFHSETSTYICYNEYIDAYILNQISVSNGVLATRQFSSSNILKQVSADSLLVTDSMYNMLTDQKIDFLVSGLHSYTYAMSLVLVEGYHLLSVLVNIIQSKKDNDFHFFTIRCALAAITQFKPFLYNLFGNGIVFFDLASKHGKTPEDAEFSELYLNRYKYLIDALDTLLPVYTEICSVMISPRNGLKYLGRMLRYEYRLRHSPCWTRLIMLYTGIARLKNIMFTPRFVALHILFLNTLLMEDIRIVGEYTKEMPSILYNPSLEEELAELMYTNDDLETRSSIPKEVYSVRIDGSGYPSYWNDLSFDSYSFACRKIKKKCANGIKTAIIKESITKFLSFYKIHCYNIAPQTIRHILNTGATLRMIIIMINNNPNTAPHSVSLENNIIVAYFSRRVPTLKDLLQTNNAIRRILSLFMLFYLNKHPCVIDYARCLTTSLGIIHVLNQRILSDPVYTIGNNCKSEDICWLLKKRLPFSNTVYNYFMTEVVMHVSKLDSVDEIIFPGSSHVLNLETYIIKWAEYMGSLPSVISDKNVLLSVLKYYYPSRFTS